MTNAIIEARKSVRGIWTVVSVDPGVKSMGVALWEDRKLVRSGIMDLEHVEKLLRGVSGSRALIVERPMYFGGRGAVAAGSGRIGVLYRLEGILVGMATGAGWTVIELTPAEWKGNLPKRITLRKINGLFGLGLTDKRGDNDIGDAIGIGSRVLGYW
jgi:hypothetical protein